MHLWCYTCLEAPWCCMFLNAPLMLHLDAPCITWNIKACENRSSLLQLKTDRGKEEYWSSSTQAQRTPEDTHQNISTSTSHHEPLFIQSSILASFLSTAYSAPISSPHKFSKQQHKGAFFSAEEETVSGFRDSTLRLNWWVLEYKCLTALGLKWPAWTIQKQNQSENFRNLMPCCTNILQKTQTKKGFQILKFNLKGNWLREKCIHHLRSCFVLRAVDTQG